MRLQLLLALSCMSTVAFGFESAKVLPKGVRNLNIKGIYTETSVKTDRHGNEISLANDLHKELKFRNVLQGEEGLKRTQLKAFMLAKDFKDEDTVGEFDADLNAQINAWAPVFAWGITDKITLAAAIPYYSTSTDINVGFRTNEGGDRFISALTEDSANYYFSAIEAAQKFRNAVGRLNERLVKNNYNDLDRWNQTGWGDTTIAAKALNVNGDRLKLATTLGVIAPTGRTDSPDILTDLPFGDGQWDAFGQLTFDQYLTSKIFFNQFAKFTHQRRDSKVVRWKTFDETVEAQSERTNFKLGDKTDAGVSIQFEQDSGITGGLGGLYYRKYGDRYTVDVPDVKSELQRDTDQNALYWQARLGYSTVEAYRRKEFVAPASISLEYRKQYSSRNMPITDFTQLDINLFF